MKGRKLQRRMVSILLSLILALCAFAPISATAADEAWDGTTRTEPASENGVYLITSGAELAWFAKYVNDGNTSASAKLMNNISLNRYDTQYKWTAIGEKESRPFKGTFDGNGKQIRYLYTGISRDDVMVRYGGLFGVVDGGEIRSLTVTGDVYHRYDGTGYSETYTAVGVICGYLKSGRILNCTNYAEISMEGETYYRNAGGIVGLSKGLVLNCTNYGRISTKVEIAQRNIGGIVGMAYGPSAKVLSSVNRGYIKGYFDVGGIAGRVKNGAEIQECCNYGILAGTNYIGGIAGIVTGTGTYSDGSSKECLIRNVYNYYNMADVNASIAGGIVAQFGFEDWKDAESPAMPVLENAYSLVTFTDSASTSRGSIVGYFRSGKIGNVYGPAGGPPVVDRKEGDNAVYSGSILTKTENEMKTISFTKLLGSAFVKTSTYDENAGYPKLCWQTRSDTLNENIQEAMLEVNSWLSKQNQVYYGSAYARIEALAEETMQKLGAVISQEQLDEVMAQAREALAAIKTGEEYDEELYAAVDEAIIELDSWMNALLMANDYTEEETQTLLDMSQNVLFDISRAKTTDEVEQALENGKAAISAQAAAYDEAKRTEEIRLNARASLTEYRSKEIYGSPYDEELQSIRSDYIARIDAAKTSEEIGQLLREAKTAIDTVITSIPAGGAWDGQTKSEPVLSDDGIYQIQNGAQLAWFSDFIAQGGTASAVLTADIDLGKHEFSPIGNDANPFMGSFDGGNHTISGLSIKEAKTYAGLFGKVYGDNNQVIENVTVSGQISVSRAAAYAGAIAGYMYGANETTRNAVVNCHSKVTITLDGVMTDGSAAGGILGFAKNTWVRQCSNDAAVSIPSEGKGGIRYFAGGIIGSAKETVSIRQCWSAGNISCGYTAGGLVGYAAGDGFAMTSDYTVSYVQAGTNAGGLIGQLAANAPIVSWCYNSGIINQNTAGKNMGAIFGTAGDGSYANLYAKRREETPTRALVGAATSDKVPGLFITEEQLKGDEILKALNGGGEYFIRDYLGTRGGYPILSWELTLEDLKTGAATSLILGYPADEYSEENRDVVSALVNEAIAKLQGAATMEEVSEILAAAREELDAVETLAAEKERLLAEAKEQTIAELYEYGNAEDYEEAEALKLAAYQNVYAKQIEKAGTIEEVNTLWERAKRDIDLLPTKGATEEERNLLAAKEVDALILDIGEVEFTDYVKQAIAMARSAYDSLSPEAAQLVQNLEILEAAEAAYAALREDAGVEPDPKDPDLYNRIKAQRVDEIIDLISDVTLESGDLIANAQKAYDSLTDAQKRFVRNYDTLKEKTLQYKALLDAEKEKEETPAETAPDNPFKPEKPSVPDQGRENEVVPPVSGGSVRPAPVPAAETLPAAETEPAEEETSAEMETEAEAETESIEAVIFDENTNDKGMEKAMEEALLKAQKIAKQMGILKLLALILAVLTLIALLIVLFMIVADRKRKERQVNYE